MRIVSVLENQKIEKRIAISGVIAIRFSVLWFSKIEAIFISLIL